MVVDVVELAMAGGDRGDRPGDRTVEKRLCAFVGLLLRAILRQ